ncbi:FG-GAP-like repeat-containing protein, partial [Phaeodactylibacter xiamenensis]
TLDITQFSSADIGQNQVILTAEDAAGNLNSCLATVTVNGASPNCSDGIQNGDETGVDCGGSCIPCAVPCADPGFTSNTIATSADGATSVYAMDLDGDGDADVLSASLNDDKIAWYENDGSGNFGAQQVITTSADGAGSVYAMDLDGDGDADVLSASSLDDKIAWYENDGSGNFGAQQVITTSADGASSVYAMDLDGDGDVDVLSASDNKIAWYENDGSGNFGAQQVITTSADGARSVYAMDLDGDGDADVLSASSYDDKIAWYENDGSGNFGAQQVITILSYGAARSVYAMDLDGDGDADVLSASLNDDKIAWYENDCVAPCPTPENITITYDCGGEVVLHWDITDPDTLVQSYTVVLDTNGQEFTSYTGLTTSELTIPAGTLQPGTDYEYTITSSCGANTTGVIDGTEIRDPLPEIIISNVV